MPPALVFFFKIAFAIRGLFWFHTNFRIACYSSVKNAGIILIGIATYLCSLKNVNCMSICLSSVLTFLFFNLLKNVYFWDRERASNWGKGRERVGDRRSEAGSALTAESPMWGLNLQMVRSWPKPKSRVWCLTEPPMHLLMFPFTLQKCLSACNWVFAQCTAVELWINRTPQFLVHF